MEGSDRHCAHEAMTGLRSALNQRAYRFARLLHLHPRQVHADINRAMGVGRRGQADEDQLRRGLAYADEQLEVLGVAARRDPEAGDDPPSRRKPGGDPPR